MEAERGALKPQISPSGTSTLCHTLLRNGIRIVGVLLVLIPLYACRRFYPIYTTTECGETVTTLDNRGLFVGVTCWNPNPYNIQILTSRRGRAYIGDGPDWANARPFGDLEVLPGSDLPEKGSGKVHIRIDTALQSLFQFVEQRETPLFLELDFDVNVQVSIGPFSTTYKPAPFKKSCGLNILAGRPGPLLCRDSFDGMVPPHVDLIDAQQELGNKPLRFTEDQVEAQIATTKAMMVAGTLFVLLPTCVLGLCLAGWFVDWLLPQDPYFPAAATASELVAKTGRKGYLTVDFQPEKTPGLSDFFGFMAWAPPAEQKGAVPAVPALPFVGAPLIPRGTPRPRASSGTSGLGGLSRENTATSETTLLAPHQRSVSRESFPLMPPALRTFSRGSEASGTPLLSARSGSSQATWPRSPQHERLVEAPEEV